MRILVLGGTAWLGGEVARAALTRGHEATCLARGQAGDAPAGAVFVRADRADDAAYASVTDQDWDGVVDVSWQPGFVRSAVAALAARTRTWVYVSSCSVYAAHDTPGADEAAALLPALEGDTATREQYGQAKVACESIVLSGAGAERAGAEHAGAEDAVAERGVVENTVVARAGLIAGPGDHTDRTGYWPLRFAQPATEDGSVLVPDASELSTQVIDVRDLAAWLVRCIEESTHGVFNATGQVTPLAEHLATARRVAGHVGPLVTAGSAWLVDHGVEEWAGPRSLPLWLSTPGWEGFAARRNDAAVAAGLELRPLEATLADTLAWELQREPHRQRNAGLSVEDERALIAAALTAPTGPGAGDR